MENKIEELKDNKDDILFQIDMQLYNEFNDKFCEINEHLGDIYTYKDLEDIKEAETEKERKLLREAIENLINRVKELEEIETEHKKQNGELQERIENLIDSNNILFYLDKNYVSKDKIKAKIEELLNSYMKVVKIEDTVMANIHNEKIDNQIKILQELLEDDKNGL